MVQAFIDGIIFGFLLAVMIGPVFFALLQTSLQQGFRAGAKMVLGVAASDLLYIAIAYFGLAPIASTTAFQYWLGILGGSIMVVFGLVGLFKKSPGKVTENQEFKKTRGWALATKAFALNALNPFVLVFWLTAVSSKVIVAYPDAPSMHMAYIAGMVLTAFTTDLAKAYAAKKLSKVLTPGLQYKLTIVVSIVLIGFGIRSILTVWNY